MSKTKKEIRAMKRASLYLAAAVVAFVLTGCGKPTPQDAMTKTVAAYKNLQSLSLKDDSSMEQSMGSQKNSIVRKITLLYQKPDKIRENMDVTGMGSMIIIKNGDKTYANQGQVKMWMVFGGEQAKNAMKGQDPIGVSIYSLLMDSDPFKGIKDAKLIGSEKVGDVDTWVVEFGIAPPPGVTGKMSQKIWIGKKDWLLRKKAMTAELRVQGMPSAAILTETDKIDVVAVNGKIAAPQFAPPAGAKIMDLSEHMRMPRR
jgi:outer membrane lipoprotein-sorting protein